MYESDNRIIQMKFTGRSGAGFTRNHGIMIVDTKWVSFVDDDDVLYEKYVELLIEHDEEYDELDAILFRMRHYKKHLDILPKPECTKIAKFHMGISFSLNMQMLRDYQLEFPMGLNEDFNLMHQVY